MLRSDGTGGAARHRHGWLRLREHEKVNTSGEASAYTDGDRDHEPPTERAGPGRQRQHARKDEANYDAKYPYVVAVLVVVSEGAPTPSYPAIQEVADEQNRQRDYECQRERPRQMHGGIARGVWFCVGHGSGIQDNSSLRSATLKVEHLSALCPTDRSVHPSIFSQGLDSQFWGDANENFHEPGYYPE